MADIWEREEDDISEREAEGIISREQANKERRELQRAYAEEAQAECDARNAALPPSHAGEAK